MVVQLHRYPGAALRCLRYVLEHVLNERPLPWLPPSVAMDLVPSMWAVVITCGLVRTAGIIGLVRTMSEQARASVPKLAAGLAVGSVWLAVVPDRHRSALSSGRVIW